MPQNNIPKLKSELGLFTTIAIVIGAVIGSGIFMKPSLMASQVGSAEILILIWIVAGVITLFGALTNAEVAGLFSETGGQYIYFEKMYGEFIAFLYGWAIFIVIQTGSIASISYVFSEYFQYFVRLPRLSAGLENSFILHIPFIGNILPLENIGVKAITVGLIFLLTIVNYFGVKFGGGIASFFTSAKVLILLFFVAIAFAFVGGNASNFTGHLSDKFSNFNGNPSIFFGVVAALSGAFWAYDGWNNVTYLAGEIKSPQKNIPLGLLIGTSIVIIIYVLVNIAYIYVLPLDEIAKSELVASDVAQKILGNLGGGFVAAAVLVSTFGTSNGTIMASSRVYHAMANRGMFFKPIGKTSPKYFTPANALFLQAFWSSLLVISGTFDTLTDMLIFVSWIFYGLGAVGVFVLRKKMPDNPRSYKVWGYPIIPIIFVLFALFFVIFTLYNDINGYLHGRYRIINSGLGLLLTFSGIPFYLIFKKIYRKKEVPDEC